MDLISLLLIFFAVELFESNWQKNDTLYGLIQNNYIIYKKNIFLYLLLHVSFFYSLGLIMYLNNFNFWMVSIVVVKFLDMAFKLSMMKKLDDGLSMEEVMPINMNMTPIIRYFNVLIYPFCFAMGSGLFF